MRKRGVIAIFVLFIIALTSAGCKQTTTTGATEDVHTGTQGLVISFMKDMPPAKIYDTTPLDALVELRNKGTSDLSGANCMLYLSGYDESIISGIDKDIYCGALEPKTLYNPDGGIATQQFTTDLINLPEGVDAYKTNLLVTACYKYQTVANPVVCIDPKQYELAPLERACTVKDVPTIGGQGAPVSVDKVEVDMMKGKVLFKITVSNHGAGTVPEAGKTSFLKAKTPTTKSGTVLYHGTSLIGECPYNLEYDDYNIVSYNVDMTGGSLIDCTPKIEGDQRVRLIDNKGTIYCTFRISGDSAYSTPLEITLDYNYMDSISREVEIIKTP